MTSSYSKYDLSKGRWEDQTVYSFKGPIAEDLDHSLLVALDRKLENDSLDTYVRDKINTITQHLKNSKVMRNSRFVLGKRLPAHELILSWSKNRTTRYKRYIFVVHEGVGFTFNCDFSKASYVLVSDQMTQVVTAFLGANQESDTV